MRYTWMVALTVVVAPLAAQGQPGRPMPRGQPIGAMQEQDTAVATLRQRIVMRFMQTYRMQAGLSDEQFGKFQDWLRQSWQHRQTLQDRERRAFQALEGQLRPGIAASPDSVNKLLDALVSIRQEEADAWAADRRSMASFLDPVQQGQLVLAVMHLQQQVQQVMQQRRRF